MIQKLCHAARVQEYIYVEEYKNIYIYKKIYIRIYIGSPRRVPAATHIILNQFSPACHARRPGGGGAIEKLYGSDFVKRRYRTNKPKKHLLERRKIDKK